MKTQGSRPRDGLHNAGEAVVVWVGMDYQAVFAANSLAIGKKSNAVDRPNPTATDPRELCRPSQDAPLARCDPATERFPTFTKIVAKVAADYGGNSHAASRLLENPDA